MISPEDQAKIKYFEDLMSQHWDLVIANFIGTSSDLYSRIYRELYSSETIRQCMICRKFVTKDFVSVVNPFSICQDCDAGYTPNQAYISKALENELYTIPLPAALKL